MAYNIQVWDETGKCIWDTGKCESDNTVNVQYEGQPLESRKEYRWTLKVWDKQGDEYETDAEKFETAILEDSEWKAEWIRGGNLLRKEFSADKKIKNPEYIYLALVIMSFILMEIRLGIMYLIRRGQTLIRRYIILYMTLQKV